MVDILVEEMDASLWVAAVENNKLQGLEVDPFNEEVRWGSIYWARVTRIDKTLDAAFLSLDGENQALLQSGDLRISKGGKVLKGGEEPIGKLLSPGDMVLVQAKEGKLAPIADAGPAFETKVPRVSMNVTLPGRYLIYTAFDETLKISRRVRDKKLRSDMTAMLKEMVDCQGCILRAASVGIQTDVLRNEFKILQEMWSQLSEYAQGEDPQLIMLGPDAVQRTLSDMAFQAIESIEVVVMDHFELVEEWCVLFAPDLITKINPIEIENSHENFALFDYRDIMEEIDRLFHPYTLLDDGATIILQQTAAITAVDVNRGADRDSNLGINLKVASEVARQLRLRNMGGQVVIDFLRMKSGKEKQELLKALEKAFDKDPCTVQIHGFTKLGLVEVARQKRTPTLQDRFESTQV